MKQLKRARQFLSTARARSVFDTAALLYAQTGNRTSAKEVVTYLKSNRTVVIESRLFLLAAVARYDKKYVSGRAIAMVIQELTSLEMQPGGPYKDEAGKINPLLNIFAATFLQEFTVLPQPLQHYISTLSEMAPSSSFKSTFLKVLSFRIVHPHKAHPQLQPTIVKFQEEDGGWPEITLFPDQKASRILATALASSVLQSTPPSNQTEHDDIYSEVKQSVFLELKQLAEPLRSVAISTAHKVLVTDKNHEILLFPYFFHSSLRTPILPYQTVTLLCHANFYAWLAYTIYDDFLDDQGNVQLLSIANFAARRSVIKYSTFSPEAAPQIQQYFDTMDAANSWELQYCRAGIKNTVITFSALPDFQDNLQLAHRSLAHILGPHLIVRSVSAAAGNHVKDGLTHYLVARQLQDDLYDWQEDFLNGHLSVVVTHLLKGVQVKTGKRYRQNELLEIMKLYFWQTGLEELTMVSRKHLKIAQQQLHASHLLVRSSPIVKLIGQLEHRTIQALEKHRTQKSFLTAYRRPGD